MSESQPDACGDGKTAGTAGNIFHASSYPEFRNLQCRFRDGVLTITGQLPTYYLKQIALKTVREVQGVVRVEDLIEVSR